jgi:conjugative transfer ATPase
MKGASPNPASRRFSRTPWYAQILHRLSGDWPLTGTPPLGVAQFRDLFHSYPAFSDYLPFARYDPAEGVFLLDDGCSVGAVFRLGAADLDARAPERLAEFNRQLDQVLGLLPNEDDPYPTILQLYLENREPPNVADQLEAATPADVRESPYTQQWFAVTRAHSDLMRDSRGIFDDARVTQAGDRPKGWRAIDQQIHACVYRKAPPSAWKKRRHTPAQWLNLAIHPFLTGLESIGVRVTRVDEDGLCAWLLPWLTPLVPGFASPQAYLTACGPLPPLEERTAAWELAQHLAQLPPVPIPERDPERDRGVWRFGECYTRFLTLQGIQHPPADGVLTLDTQNEKGVIACPWDRLPPNSILTWTLIPRSPLAIDEHLDQMQLKVDQTTSESAHAAAEQLAVAKAARRQQELIFNTQMGVYLRAPSLQRLDDDTLATTNVLALAGFTPIPAKYDLLADDSFVRNLPMVYDWRYDRRHALRSRLTHAAHIAAVLPFFGRATGTAHPCFVGWHRRDGQCFHMNFYHPADRARVAHTVVFGQTGSGKSATLINMLMSSMAVNRPRQIIIEKGNSFGLMCAYYARQGLTVREIVFNPLDPTLCYPPYLETAKALAEHRGEFLATGEGEGDGEQRSYIDEMLYMTLLMITGGRTRELDALTTSDRAAIQTGLLRGLEASAQAGDPHARPLDVRNALLLMAEDEKIPEIRLHLRALADALALWTQGLRGQLFNRHSPGFATDVDVFHVELGVLTHSGNDDMLALAVLSLLASITAQSEHHQTSGRHTEVCFDEAHYIAKTPLLVQGFIVGTKVWRKLHTWLLFATQDFSDASELAKQILSQAEFWVLLSMGAHEARQVARFRDMSAEEQRLLTLALKDPGHYVEGVLLSERHAPALLRFVPPALALALAQTEGAEKNQRLRLMNEHHISELDAAIQIAEDLTQRRRQHRQETEA